MKTKIIIAVFLIVIPVHSLFAWLFGEHKEIGEIAFQKSIEHLIAKGYFADSTEASDFLLQFAQMKYDAATGHYFFDQLSHETNIITYGALNALAGDHEENPLAMDESLRRRISKLNRIVSLQNQAIGLYEWGADDVDVASYDFGYLLLALNDMSHFYDYGDSFYEHIEDFNKEHLLQLNNPSKVGYVMNELRGTNAINKYITLHLFAVYIAEQSGIIAKTDITKAETLFYYAIIFNSFADHFLEDCFASGHIVVNRSIWGAFTDNVGLHNFYNDHGVEVANLKWETWRQYGDGNFDERFSPWESHENYQELNYPKYSPDSERVFDAVSASILDIFNAFKYASEDDNYTFIVNRIPSNKNELFNFFVDEIASINYIPIPFNTDIAQLNPPAEKSDLIKTNTAHLSQRGLFRARISNSANFDLSLKVFSPDDRFEGPVEFRINFGSNYYWFNYNLEHTKAGVLDTWIGTTISSTYSWLSTDTNIPWLEYYNMKGGLRYYLDFWVSDTRFISLYGYLEAGYENRDNVTRALFSPSIGMQLLPLIGLTYFDCPVWLRTPLEMVLPLFKIRYGADFIPGRKPSGRFIVDFEFVF